MPAKKEPVVTIQKSFYLFYGEDTFRSREKAVMWRKEFEKKFGDLNTHVFDGAKMTFNNFESAVQTYPFLADKKLVLIENFLENGKKDEQDKVVKMLPKVEDFCFVVFSETSKPDARTVLYKTLTKLGKTEEFKSLTPQETQKWIGERFAKLGVQIGMREASYLAETIGSDLWQLHNEIQKLVLFAHGKPVTVAMIDQITSANITSTIFKLTDALGAKNLPQTLENFSNLLESGEEIMGVFYRLVGHFRTMAQVRAAVDQGLNKAAIAKELKAHPFFVEKLILQSRNFGMNELREVYQNFFEIDKGIKTGKIRISTNDVSELKRVVEVMLVKLSGVRK